MENENYHQRPSRGLRHTVKLSAEATKLYTCSSIKYQLTKYGNMITSSLLLDLFGYHNATKRNSLKAGSKSIPAQRKGKQNHNIQP